MQPLRSKLGARCALGAVGALVVACGGSGGTTVDAHADSSSAIDAPTADAGCATKWAVDVTTGSDAAAGTCAAPFKTITHAMTVAASGESIQVAPGAYSAATGETFPLAIAAGVTLLGDEAHKGVGSTATTVTGHAVVSGRPSGFTTTLTMATGSTVAGFKLVNDDPNNLEESIQVWLYGENTITVRNSTLDLAHYGVYFENASMGAAVIGNVITNHVHDGILFAVGGTATKIQGNTITANQIGVEYDSAGGDLGGGAAGSTGGNTISCNTMNDIWTNTASISITATNNLWDHAPPTTATSPNTTDIFNGQSVSLTTTGAALAAAPCP